MTKISKIIVASVGLLLGIIIIIIGINVQSVYGTYMSEYDVGKPIEFGADFYTEMYDVTKDVGNAINNASNDIGAAISNATRYICEAVGWLIISIGLIDICVFTYKLFGSLDAVFSNNSNTQRNTYDSQNTYTASNTAYNNTANASYNTSAKPTYYSNPAQAAPVNTQVNPVYNAPSQAAPVNNTANTQSAWVDISDGVKETVKDTRSKEAQWLDAEQKYGGIIGKCENCGAKKETLIFAECTDFFGTTEKNVCFDCFCKKDGRAIPRR